MPPYKGVKWTFACCAALALATTAGATPIPGPLSGPLPRYKGAATKAHPLRGAFPKHNPALAPDGTSGSGLQAANGAASPLPGPLGRSTSSQSALQFGTCASLAFAKKHLIAVCNGPMGPTLRELNPTTLTTEATLALPARGSADRTDLSGGTHFIVRRDGTLLVPTNNRQLETVTVQADALEVTATRDLTPFLSQNEKPFATAAGYDANDWVTGNQGTVIAIPRKGGAPKLVRLHEPIAEDLATDPTGAYVVTTAALYRLKADADGAPRVVWRLPIPQGLPDTNAGRVHAGSGTPPVVIPGGYVAVADGEDPPRVLVARTNGTLACATTVFTQEPHGSIEAQLVAAGHSIVAANAYGYPNPTATEGGRTTTGGLTQIQVTPRGCHTAWHSRLISPSAQMVVSRRTGLLYTLEKPPGFPDAWNLAAIDWRTGKTRFEALAGEGLGYNSEGGAIALGPDGAAYAGSFGGVTRFKDAR